MQVAEVSSWIALGEGAQLTHTRNPKIALLCSFYRKLMGQFHP